MNSGQQAQWLNMRLRRRSGVTMGMAPEEGKGGGGRARGTWGGSGKCFKKSSAGNLENASSITDSTNWVTWSRIWGLTSLIMRPEFWLMKSFTVRATWGARPSKRFSICTLTDAMSKSILVRLMLNFWLPGGPTGSMAADPTPVTPFSVAWNEVILHKSFEIPSRKRPSKIKVHLLLDRSSHSLCLTLGQKTIFCPFFSYYSNMPLKCEYWKKVF